MPTKMLIQPVHRESAPKEGDVYKLLRIRDRCFKLAYGYYEPWERENPAIEPMPIYPDFVATPCYTKDGRPFVTKMQDICPYFHGELSCFSECAECSFYHHEEDLIGICLCPQRKEDDVQANQEVIKEA